MNDGLLAAILFSRPVTAEEQDNFEMYTREEDGTVNPLWAQLSFDDDSEVMAALIPIITNAINAGNNAEALIELLKMRDEAAGFYDCEKAAYRPLIDPEEDPEEEAAGTATETPAPAAD